ncbi:hypothetical protein B7486_72625 [cyanobacterium TDX16]|nr:hypothetical protein B7486_72625 [cyanobacterium TDX16]
MRPALRRIYTVTDDWRAAEPSLGRLGFTPVGSPIVGADHDGTVQPLVLDFGPGSIDGWLSDLIQLDVGPPTDHAGLVDAEAAEKVATLSPREHEVVALLAEGLTNRQLAERLFISERTANRHVSNIFTKLGVSSRAAAASLATRAGMERPMEHLPDAIGPPPV